MEEVAGSIPASPTKLMKKTKPKFDNEWGIDPKFIGFDRKHDSYYDKRDGRWLDKRCGNPKCGYCSKRPLRARIMR